MDEIQKLNDQLTGQMNIILKCTDTSNKYGKLLLASEPETRYPYVYPRDSSCAIQLFRRLAGSSYQYDAGNTAYEIMESMAHFMKDVQAKEGNWGQRYSLSGEDKSIYKQEDNVAHGIALICNYLLTAHRLKKRINDLDGLLNSVNKGLDHALKNFYEKELNLFYSTTSIHESAIETGFTNWVNFAFLYALSLSDEVACALDRKQIIRPQFKQFRKKFLYSVSELFMSGQRYIRRIDAEGHIDLRPDFTLLSPFYFGFLHYKTELENSIKYIEKQLHDSEFGMIMRYLPFYKDFATHVHAGNGPWMQYTAILAQFHYWKGNISHGDKLMSRIDSYKNDKGEIPEHLSTCKRFEYFMENEWKTGIDFDKEFHKPILLDNLEFDKILEETNNMSKSYQETGSKCMFTDASSAEGGYIEFAVPLMWSHVEYSRALLMKANDWWKVSN